MSWYVLVLKIVESGVGCDGLALFGIEECRERCWWSGRW